LEKVSLLFPVLSFFVIVKSGAFVLFRIYRMTWRYVGLYDLLSIMRNVRSEERGVRSEKGRYGTIEIV
jgi:FlaA1/EpsC-like NDP-sugar epimerase